MVTTREALIDGGLEMAARPGSGGTAWADQVVKPKGRKPRKLTTSRELTANVVPERTASGVKYDIRSARATVTRRQLAESIAAVRAQRPHLPLRSLVDGRLTAGLEATVRDDGYLIGCVSDKHWTRGLDLSAFPEGVSVRLYGPNGIIITPLVATDDESEGEG